MLKCEGRRNGALQPGFHDFRPDRLSLVPGILELLETSSSFCGSVCHTLTSGRSLNAPRLNLLAPPTSRVPPLGAVRFRLGLVSTVIGFRLVGVLPIVSCAEGSLGTVVTVGEKSVTFSC